MRTLAQIKADLIAAHRSGDGEAARRLSQERERAKRRGGVCSDCGCPVGKRSLQCVLHSVARRYYRHALATVTIVASVSLISCTTPKHTAPPKPAAFSKIHRSALAGESVPQPGSGWVTLAWECPSPGSYTTGLIASTDFKTWQEVAAFPASNHVTITLSNRPPAEFYRAFTRL